MPVCVSMRRYVLAHVHVCMHVCASRVGSGSSHSLEPLGLSQFMSFPHQHGFLLPIYPELQPHTHSFPEYL